MECICNIKRLLTGVLRGDLRCEMAHLKLTWMFFFFFFFGLLHRWEDQWWAPLRPVGLDFSNQNLLVTTQTCHYSSIASTMACSLWKLHTLCWFLITLAQVHSSQGKGKPEIMCVCFLFRIASFETQSLIFFFTNTALAGKLLPKPNLLLCV